MLRWFLAALAVCISRETLIATAGYCKPDPYSMCWPTSSRLAAFRASLSNASRVIMPSNPEFLGKALVMNSLKAAMPAFIVYPSNEADLLATVALAAKKCIRLVVRCSGHDYNDRSTGLDVIVLNTQLLKNITYNAASQLVTIAAGCNWGDVYEFVASIGRVVVGGSSKSVCTAGYLLGGGHGVFSPQYGLGADNVESLRIALYNGTAINATRTVNSDLFHAMLGSGASTYGVLISVTYRTHPAPPFIYVIRGVWPVSSPEPGQLSVMDYLLNMTWFEAKPLTLVGYHTIMGGTVTAQWVYVGYTDAQYTEAMIHLGPLYGLPGYDYGSTAAANYSSMYEYAVASYDPPTNLWARKLVSNVMLPVDQEMLDGIRDGIIANPTVPFWLWYVFGGATTTGTSGSVPPGLRTGLGEVSWGSQWLDPAEDEGIMNFVSSVTNYFYPLFANSYVNEYSAWHGKYNAVADWQTRFYSNFSGLLEVKKKYDPCNLYTVEYGVGYGLPTATCKCK